MFRSLLIVALGMMALSSCRKSEDPTPVQDQDWFSTSQPGATGYTIYSTTPPIGRGYAGFRLNSDGTYLEYAPAPADGQEERPGTWQAEGKLTYRITFRDATRPGYQLRIKNPSAEHLEARMD
ncbi:hypothetical protein KLP40_01075 [Hymenobacter sp. NST-14]|uniref:hypothetical protein n=1 Tax=Hymenobacter piscis TaxID=2839984 RepID=UPI001C024CFE|nr:hypothetical protein [Hymenobacter piscis]MBT9391739.1 hypothetical protein [Hymenobacter piscis]